MKKLMQTYIIIVPGSIVKLMFPWLFIWMAFDTSYDIIYRNLY